MVAFAFYVAEEGVFHTPVASTVTDLLALSPAAPVF